ncbi:hypothetical protein DPMN_076258 [Dreissena polymorpha]|uniref:Uncharacterized protein n=1 Tax=Dreissena polymorpha TaxID=45954 RepID=A0A9D3YL63_DREPO|nr:hypothetical protein DPMN_076258 [Dreissena polymorpha]
MGEFAPTVTCPGFEPQSVTSPESYGSRIQACVLPLPSKGRIPVAILSLSVRTESYGFTQGLEPNSRR